MRYKTALYIRISKADGTQDTSRQLNELRDFANAQNWQIVEEIEEHISGRKTNRSGTQKLINLAKSNKIQKVLIHEVSRLGRNACDTYNTVEELAKNKVSVFDYHQRQETLDKYYNKTIYANIILPVLAGLSEQWLSQHVYRIKSGLENARKKGTKIGRPKQEKLKKEDEILKLRKTGYIIDDFGRKKKSSYVNIARQLNIGSYCKNRVNVAATYPINPYKFSKNSYSHFPKIHIKSRENFGKWVFAQENLKSDRNSYLDFLNGFSCSFWTIFD